MSFEFGDYDPLVKKKNQNKRASMVHFGSADERKKRHVLFLLETPINAKMQTSLNTWVKTRLGKAFDYDIVSASPLSVTTDEIKKNGIYRFYQDNRSDYESYIRPNETIVVSFGIALSAITLSSDLKVECFQDFVFNKTYFYSPRLDCHVFPVDGVDALFGLSEDSKFYRPRNCSHRIFAERQLDSLKSNYEELKVGPGQTRTRILCLHSKDDWHNFYLEHNKDKRPVAWDIETSGLSWFRDRVGCITMSFDGRTGYFIPWRIVDKDELSDLMKDRYQIGQNLKFDIKFLRHLGVKNLKIDSDTLQLGQMLNEMRFNGLKSLAYYYTTHGGYDYELDQYCMAYNPVSYLAIPEPLLAKYATMDAIVNFQVHEAMQEQLTALDATFPPLVEGGWSMRDFYEKIKMPAVNNFINVELRGFFVNMEKWNYGSDVIQGEILAIKEELKKRLDMSEEDLEETYDDDTFFDFADEESVIYKIKDTLQSGKRLGEFLEKKGWECLGRTKQGWYATGDAQLERWIQLGHSEAELIQNMRSYLTLQKTFIGRKEDPDSGWRRFVDQYPDGSYRISPTYKSMLMDTMRNGCGDPNYQQLPSSSLGAEYMKKVITVPDPEKYYLVTLDYSSFQIRLATVDSEDPVLMKAYQDNPDVDLHSLTSFNIFLKGVELDIEEVVITDGDRTLTVFAHEEVKITRNGEVMKVKASELLETDSLV